MQCGRAPASQRSRCSAQRNANPRDDLRGQLHRLKLPRAESCGKERVPFMCFLAFCVSGVPWTETSRGWALARPPKGAEPEGFRGWAGQFPRDPGANFGADFGTHFWGQIPAPKTGTRAFRMRRGAPFLGPEFGPQNGAPFSANFGPASGTAPPRSAFSCVGASGWASQTSAKRHARW